MSVGPDWLSRGSIPLVILTPRVRVSRMCTLSVIWLAASVRRISAVISSSDGICSNASACAERRSLARCSSEPEDPPAVQAQALPDGVAALHDRVERADRGLVAMRQPAADADDQVPVALVEGLQHGVLLGLPDDSAIRGTAVSSAPAADLASTENIGGRPRSHGRVGRQSLRTAGPEIFTDGNTAG